MSELNQSLPQKKLPVWSTFQEAFRFSWGHRRVLWVWILLGVFLAGLVDIVNLLEYGEGDGGLTGLQYFAMILLTPIPSLLVFALLAVYCHRTFLIYQGRKNITLQFFFTERERKLFAWVIGIPLCVFLVILPGVMTIVFIWYQINEMFQDSFLVSTFGMGLFIDVVGIFPFYYIFGRWALVFPAITIDQDPKLGWSWKQTKGNSFRMFFLVGFLPLAVGHLWYLLPFIGLSELPVVDFFLSSFVLFLFTPVEVAVISIAFRELTNWAPSPSESA